MSRIEILREKEKGYYYLFEGFNQITDDDGESLRFDSRAEAVEFVKEMEG